MFIINTVQKYINNENEGQVFNLFRSYFTSKKRNNMCLRCIPLFIIVDYLVFFLNMMEIRKL